MQKTVIQKIVIGSGLLSLGLLMSACAPVAFDPGYKETATPQNAWMSKQINVNKLTPTAVVTFTPGTGAMSELEKGRLLGFIEAQGIGYGEEVEVELPPFENSNGLNEQRFGALAGFLQDRGFNVTPRVARETQNNMLRVYFVKYVATVDPICDRGWTNPKGLSYENLPLPHLGCATASNLANMVA
ncbi:MAG: hypothetical protein EP348_00125, partial [Alphaproteobacteria bacterium]